MKRTLRRIGLAASLSATMALAGAGPALAGHSPAHPKQGKGPKVATGHPPNGALVVHCKRLGVAGAKGVMVLKVQRNGPAKFRNKCRGLPPGFELPAAVAQRLLDALDGRPVPPGLQPLLP